MFWLCLQFSHECFVISHLLSTGWWIHNTFNDNQPQISLSWHSKNVKELLSSESDCHTLWKGSTNWKIERFSKIASANWTGRVSGECHRWQRRNWICPLELLLANSFLHTLVPTFCIWLLPAVLALSPHLSIFHVLFIFLHYKLWYKMFQTG